MTRRIVIEQAAEFDIFEAVTYYREEGSPVIARRFVSAAEETFNRLAQMPEIGRQYQTLKPRLQHLRVWRVRGFESYLIFYHSTAEMLFIERVLHGNRDIEQIFEDELF